MKITRRQIRRILKEALADVVSINARVRALVSPSAHYTVADILTDIRGLRNVITVTQKGPGIPAGGEKEFLNLKIKFENEIDVDIPTLKVQIERIPGVDLTRILSVDNIPYTMKMAKTDYEQARSKAGHTLSKERASGSESDISITRFED